MIIQLKPTISPKSRANLDSIIAEIGYKSLEVKTQFQNYLVATGTNDFDIRRIGSLKGIKDIHRVTDDYKLVSRKWKLNRTKIYLGDDVYIGENKLSIMAGPCSIESEEQIENTVAFLLANGIKIMRGGVYKPRSSPYSFRGLGIDGLKLFYKHCRKNGIKIITEVMQVSQIDPMLDYVDIFQVGARNAQNFNLLDALGQIDKAVMLKRGISGSINELLQSAEYVFSNGNEKIVLCERGIRTFENAYRNTLDLNAIPILKEKSHLPIIVDPSHGIGIRKHVARMALAGIVAGADGLILEVHQTPEKAISDGQQALSFIEAKTLFSQLKTVSDLQF